jgi:aminomethyltransferase
MRGISSFVEDVLGELNTLQRHCPSLPRLATLPIYSSGRITDDIGQQILILSCQYGTIQELVGCQGASVIENPSTPKILKETPLCQCHQDLNARLMEFGGWSMPVQYQGITAEHLAVRQRVGMFDISHMGKFVLKGKSLRDQLQALVPSDLSQLQPGQAKYTVFLNQQAGILDDLIFYYQGQDHLDQELGILIVNAVTTAQDRAWVQEHLGQQVEFEDVSTTQVLIAVQGPMAIATLATLTSDNLNAIGNYRHHQGQILGQPAWFARTGYTGEDGFEVMVTPEVGQELWQVLLKQGVTPCGLGARDTLRLEAAMVLYGQDIDDTTTPFEAGLTWLVDLDKGEFMGRAALIQQQQVGIQRRLVGLEMEGRSIARHDYPILVEDKTVGIVTSGTFSPTLGKAIALAYVPPSYGKIGQALTVTIRNKPCSAIVVKRPFYRRPKNAR